MPETKGGGDWKRLTVPGDVDGLLTVGAVTRERQRAYFSSVGPTADGRIKPDVAGIGCRSRYHRPRREPAAERRHLVLDPHHRRAHRLPAASVAPPLGPGDYRSHPAKQFAIHSPPTACCGYGIPDFQAAYRQGSGTETIRTGQTPLQLTYREGSPVVTIGPLPPDESEIALGIYDLEGALLQEYRLPEGAELDLHDLKKGIYLLSARGRQHSWTQKIQRL